VLSHFQGGWPLCLPTTATAYAVASAGCHWPAKSMWRHWYAVCVAVPDL